MLKQNILQNILRIQNRTWASSLNNNNILNQLNMEHKGCTKKQRQNQGKATRRHWPPREVEVINCKLFVCRSQDQ